MTPGVTLIGDGGLAEQPGDVLNPKELVGSTPGGASHKNVKPLVILDDGVECSSTPETTFATLGLSGAGARVCADPLDPNPAIRGATNIPERMVRNGIMV